MSLSLHFFFTRFAMFFSPKVTSTSARLIGSSTRGSASGVFDEYGMVPLPKRITWVFWGGRDGCSCHLWFQKRPHNEFQWFLFWEGWDVILKMVLWKTCFFSFLNKYNYTYRSWFSIWTGAIFIVTKPSSLGEKLAQNTPNKFRLRHLTQNLPRFFSWGQWCSATAKLDGEMWAFSGKTEILDGIPHPNIFSSTKPASTSHVGIKDPHRSSCQACQFNGGFVDLFLEWIWAHLIWDATHDWQFSLG